MLMKWVSAYAKIHTSRMVADQKLLHPYLRSSLSDNMILELKDIQM